MECAISFGVSSMRGTVRQAALLEIWIASYTVPRNILQQLFDRRIPGTVSDMACDLLAPMPLQTTNHKSQRYVHRLLDTPQSGHPSHTLFKIFMDDYVRLINTSPSRLSATLFVDDVVLVAKSMADIQKRLRLSIE